MPRIFTRLLKERSSEIDEEDFQYRKRFLNIVFIIGFLLPVYCVIEALFRGDSWNFIILGIVEVLVALCFLASKLLKPRGTEILISFILLVYPIGYIWGSFAPGNYQLYILILLIMPAIFDTLVRASQYRFWLAYVLFFASVPILSFFAGYPSMWFRDFPTRTIAIIHLVFIILWVLRNITSNQLMNYADEITGGIIRDKGTGLSTIVMFRRSFIPGKEYFMALVSIGNFRELSTLFGYSITGDLLSSAASRLKAAASDLDAQVFRLRGHDLGFVKRLDDGNSVKDLAPRLLRYLAWPFSLRGKEIELSYRLGYTIVSDGNAEKALDEAYEALGAAERDGLDLAGYEPAWNKMREAEFATTDLMTLSRNVTEGTLAIFYQPIVALSSGKIAWNEALVRFQGTGKELEEPSRIMKLASTTGHWAAIEDFMFYKAAEKARSDTGPVSINIALRDLDREAFRDSIEFGAREAREKNSTVILEILEGDFGLLTPSRNSIIRDLRKAGCLIAIDDFGMGYSNYSRLMAMPVDIVKFDSSLMLNARGSKAEMALLKSIVRFCFDIGALTVAEGLENEGLVEFAIDLNFDFGQGYYWSKPVPETQIHRAERSPLLVSKFVRFDGQT
ncbi:MAG: GGDEF domain-containing protein [Spirochaetes bacterium]|nr:GGDEF domain-containing protein [Spirochaetota bacterium]